MEFIETLIFTKLVQQEITPEEYRQLQEYLILNPHLGDVIKNSGGLRKVRWRSKNKGKSGGVRVIYYYKDQKNLIYFLLIYPKNKQDNLSDKQLKILRNLMEDFNHG